MSEGDSMVKMTKNTNKKILSGYFSDFKNQIKTPDAAII
jgi:hypothetical protein